MFQQHIAVLWQASADPRNAPGRYPRSDQEGTPDPTFLKHGLVPKNVAKIASWDISELNLAPGKVIENGGCSVIFPCLMAGGYTAFHIGQPLWWSHRSRLDQLANTLLFLITTKGEGLNEEPRDIPHKYHICLFSLGKWCSQCELSPKHQFFISISRWGKRWPKTTASSSLGYFWKLPWNLLICFDLSKWCNKFYGKLWKAEINLWNHSAV